MGFVGFVVSLLYVCSSEEVRPYRGNPSLTDLLHAEEFHSMFGKDFLFCIPKRTTLYLTSTYF
jgi:hypothetical protein